MSVTMINEDYRSLGLVRYFLSDRCINNTNLQKFNQGMIKANELIVFGENESDLSLLAIADKAYVHSGSELLGKHVEAARVYSSLSEVVKEITE